MESREYIGYDASLPGMPTSPWLATAPETSYGKLRGAVDADVAVVGAGLAGVVTAYLLAQDGRRVVLLERRRACGNATGHTTAKATIHHGPLYRRLRRSFGELGALRYALANLRGLNLIARLCGEVGCDFSWVPSYVYAESPDGRGEMRDEARVMAGMGLRATYEEVVPVPFPLAAAVRLEHQGRFDPARLVVRLLERRPPTLRVFEETPVTGVDDGQPCVVTTDAGEVRAHDVVLASQFPAVDTGAFFSRLFPHTSMAVAVRVAEPLPDAVFYCETPEHALRTYGGDRRLAIVSGEPHPTGEHGDDRDRYLRLLEWTRTHFRVEEVLYHWSTEDFDTPDGVPYVGRSPLTRHLWVATGFGGWGMTNSAAAALTLRDLIAGRNAADASPFDPSRAPATGAGRMLASGARTVEEFTLGRLTQPRVRDPQDLEPDQGAVVVHGGHTTAAYRAPGGDLTLLDPTCRHLACQVTWNEAEKTWDCPCHGSRYASDGTPLYAPTRRALGTRTPTVAEPRRRAQEGARKR